MFNAHVWSRGSRRACSTRDRLAIITRFLLPCQRITSRLQSKFIFSFTKKLYLIVRPSSSVFLWLPPTVADYRLKLLTVLLVFAKFAACITHFMVHEILVRQKFTKDFSITKLLTIVGSTFIHICLVCCFLCLTNTTCIYKNRWNQSLLLLVVQISIHILTFHGYSNLLLYCLFSFRFRLVDLLFNIIVAPIINFWSLRFEFT